MEYTERTKAEQIANAYFDMGADWSASGGLLKELREMEDGYIKQLADAQATIAALQDTIIQMGGQAAVLAKDAMAAKEQIAALQAERDEYKTMYACLTGETYDNPIADLKAQLTQRTAELEAIKADTKNMLDVATSRLREQVNDLQAELERVRGELQSAEAGYFVAERDLQGMNNRYDDLRTLIAALPKVEGEIQATRIPCAAAIGEWWYVGWIRFPNERTAQSYVDLLRHRQGMEG